jgi:hypothetical protein
MLTTITICRATSVTAANTLVSTTTSGASILGSSSSKLMTEKITTIRLSAPALGSINYRHRRSDADSSTINISPVEPSPPSFKRPRRPAAPVDQGSLRTRGPSVLLLPAPERASSMPGRLWHKVVVEEEEKEEDWVGKRYG